MTPEKFEKLVGEFIVSWTQHMWGPEYLRGTNRCKEISAEFKQDRAEAKGCEKWPNGPMKPEEDEKAWAAAARTARVSWLTENEETNNVARKTVEPVSSATDTEEDDPRVLALSPLARELYDKCDSVKFPNEWERVAAVMKEMFDVACKAVAEMWATPKTPTPPADDEGMDALSLRLCQIGQSYCGIKSRWTAVAAEVQRMIDAAVGAALKTRQEYHLSMIEKLRDEHSLALRSAKREGMHRVSNHFSRMPTNVFSGLDVIAEVVGLIAALDAEGKS